jgi:hypothetical protein
MGMKRMLNHITLIILFPLLVSAQSDTFFYNTGLVNAYTQAIGDFINAVYERDSSRFDTLFFGRHTEFPDIALPPGIYNTSIRQLTMDEADKKRIDNKSLVYINLFSWVTMEKSEFIFVAFYPGYLHQYDCMINYQYNHVSKDYVMEKLKFKNYAYK